MFQRIFNQWPRMALVAILLFVPFYAMSGVNFFSMAPDEIPLLSVVLVSLTQIAIFAVLATVVSVVLVALVSVALPDFMNLVEVAATTLLLFATLYPLQLALGLPDEIATFSIIALMMLTSQLLSGPLSRFLPRMNWGPKTVSFRTRLSPEEVWPRIVHAPETIGQYYSPGAMTMPAPEGTGADFILCIPRRYGYTDTANLTYLSECTPPHHVIERSAEVHNHDKISNEIVETTIVPVAGGSLVTLSQQWRRVSPGYWLHLTLYSAHRDLAMCLRARLEGRRDYSLLGRQIRKHETLPAPALPASA